MFLRKDGGEMKQKYANLRLMLSGGGAGLINGLLGAGGGMVLVPALLWICKMESRSACATSVAVITPFSLVSAAVYLLRGNVFPGDALWYCIGGGIGGLLGGWLLGKLPTTWLLRLFGGLMVLAGIRQLIR